MKRIILLTRNFVFLTLFFAMAGIFSCQSTDTQMTSTSKAVIDHYTCSMHPEIKSDKPGICPKCEMNLVPVYKKESAESKVDQ